jgi:hypothetical protein
MVSNRSKARTRMQNVFKWSRGVLLLVLFFSSSCGLKDQAVLNKPVIPVQDLDTSSLIFSHGAFDPTDVFLGYHVMYKFFKQESPESLTNLSSLVETFDNTGISPSPDVLKNSYQFFSISSFDNNPDYKPSIPMTAGNKTTDNISILMDFTALLDDFALTGLDPDDIEEPFFYLSLSGSPLTTFYGASDGQIPFKRGVINESTGQLYSFKDFYETNLGDVAEQADLDHLNLEGQGTPYDLEAVFFIYSYGYSFSGTIGEVLSEPVAWGIIKDVYRWD